MNVLRILGFVLLGIGVAGIVLPLLPATPFILLAAACFARSSEKWHNWLLKNETFGPMILNWEQHRCITCRVKIIAIASMVIVGGFSVFYAVETNLIRMIGGGFIVLGLLTVAFIPTCRSSRN